MNKFLCILLWITLISIGPLGWLIAVLAWKQLKDLWNA